MLISQDHYQWNASVCMFMIMIIQDERLRNLKFLQRFHEQWWGTDGRPTTRETCTSWWKVCMQSIKWTETLTVQLWIILLNWASLFMNASLRMCVFLWNCWLLLWVYCTIIYLHNDIYISSSIIVRRIDSSHLYCHVHFLIICYFSVLDLRDHWQSCH